MASRGRKRRADTDSSEDIEPDVGGAGDRRCGGPSGRPTDYLRSRCPACFAGSRRLSLQNPDAPDALIAIDACFSQKHNKQTRDPVFEHPRGIMLGEAIVKVAEDRVRALRSRGMGGRRTKPPPFDARAAGIQVPSEALQNCEDRFKAAQTEIAKANTGSHDVTAAMALLCR
ncbi:hypothetical protein HDZ31DRAFT_51594, partial [Schizophyllum fasciatum]